MEAARHLVVVVSVAVASLLPGCADQPTHVVDGTGAGTNGQGGDGAGVAEGAGGAGHGGASNGAGGDGGEAPQPATFEITIGDPAAEIELRDSVDINISIVPHGYVGSVILNVDGLPNDVAMELSGANVPLDGIYDQSVTLKLSSASSTATGTFPFTVHGTVPGGAKTDDATITVLPVITIIIPPDLNSFSSDPPSTDAFGDFPTIVKALPNMSPDSTITVNFFNADNVTHEIHADNDAEGFVHGDQLIPPNSFDPVVRHVNSPGTYGYYPHDIGPTILGEIDIQ